MSRRTTKLSADNRDGTSQAGRRLLALEPDYAAVDERGHGDLLAFARAYTEQLLYYDANDQIAGDWRAFLDDGDATIDDLVAYLEDPKAYTGGRARWLSRPHLALLLTFIKLLGHAREQINGLTLRHLDYYYREVLGLGSRPATPDRAAVLVELARRVEQLHLPTGTQMQAGTDSAGKPRIYTSDRDVYINRAKIEQLRSVFADIETTTLLDLPKDADLAPGEVYDAMIELALGQPAPGDPVPSYGETPVDHDFMRSVAELTGFATDTGGLYLEHHELRTLMRLRARRADDQAEWDEINERLGLTGEDAPADPRDFDTNLAAAVTNTLDFDNDGLELVDDIYDLYEYRDDVDVSKYIDDNLDFGRENFDALMPIKLRIDGEWAEINRLLERLGQRARGTLGFDLSLADPTDFDTNLVEAFGAYSPPWPASWGVSDIDGYYDELQAVEDHLSMSAERLDRAAEIAEMAAQGVEPNPAEAHWPELAELLEEAHRERSYAARRDELASERAGADTEQALESLAKYVLALDEQDFDWPALLGHLGAHLGSHQTDLLDRFYTQLGDAGAPRVATWEEAERVLELAWRSRAGIVDPISEKTTWHNLYAREDATSAVVGDMPRWRLFGQQRPSELEAEPPEPSIGWAIRSPLLELRSGRRQISVTFGFEPEGFSLERVQAAMDAGAFTVELSTADGYVTLPIVDVVLKDAIPGDDYWWLTGDDDDENENESRAGLKLYVVIDETEPALAAVEGSGDRWPSLRLRLRQLWDEDDERYRIEYEAFAALHLFAIHLKVAVTGLSDLQLSSEGRTLDVNKPFKPFGNRPSTGSRLHLSHPELVLDRLESLSFAIEWMDLPEEIGAHYQNYPKVVGLTTFDVTVSLIEQGRARELNTLGLFTNLDDNTKTLTAHSLDISDVPGALEQAEEGFVYTPRLDVTPERDLRRQIRAFTLELRSSDFGHADYSILATRKAREFSVALSQGKIDDSETPAAGTVPSSDFEVRPPYTPTIKQLTAAYSSCIELRFDDQPDSGATGAEHLMHVHPFGFSPAPTQVLTANGTRGPRLIPQYEQAGELYVGLRDLEPNQRLSLLVQLADGSANADLPQTPVSWSVLSGDRWLDLNTDGLHVDETRGLVNSGLVEIEVPQVEPSTLLPTEGGALTWLRVAISEHANSVCDALALHTQAVPLRFVDNGNAEDHYAEPLAVGSIDRLRKPRAEVVKITQPYTGFGGHGPEDEAGFVTRVSERLRHKHRALTPWDYERLTLDGFPQIYKAKCLRATPDDAYDQQGRVRVIVIPDIRRILPRDPFEPKTPASLLAQVAETLAPLTPAHTQVQVQNPHYVPIMVRMGVRFYPDVDATWARRQLIDELNRYLSPWAYDEGAELVIGGRIYANSIIDFVERRDYVDYLAELKLFRSLDGVNFEYIVPGNPEGYYVTVSDTDQILVASRDHEIDLISERGYDHQAFSGLNYMKLELDFVVG